jgi:hypothetical protein
MREKTLDLTVDEWMGMYHIAADRADKAEAEVERYKLMVKSITGGLDEAIETVHYLETENALLHKVADAARGVCALCPVRDTCVPNDCWVWPIKVALKEGER